MIQLTEQQINSLFDFTRSKYVRYIDVQHELVDHLASDIEKEMTFNSSLSFDQALQKVYAKFPISGFSKFVRKSESSMHRFWGEIIFRQFTKFAAIPLLITLGILTNIQYQLMTSFGVPILYTIIIIAIAINYISMFKLNSILNIGFKNGNDSYLVVSIFRGFAMGSIFIPIMITNLISGDSTKFLEPSIGISWKLVFFCSIISAGLVWSAMAYFKFPQLIRTVLNDKYSHLKLPV